MPKISPDISKEDFIKLLSTRELLSKRHIVVGYDWDNCEYYLGGTSTFSRMASGGVQVKYDLTWDEIRSELSKRPHIPNKRESRGLRIKRKREGRGR